MDMKRIIIGSILALTSTVATQTVSAQFNILKYGDFESWITRPIKESRIIGGQTKNVYAVGPNATVTGGKPYTNTGGSPWGTSNVLAKVAGITKTSNAVYPDERSAGNRCCKLTTQIEHCKAVGVIDIDVLVAGTLFLGRMLEPIKSTSNPYSKMEMGIPCNKRPKSLRYDYKVLVPRNGETVYSSGMGKKKTHPGTDKAEVFVLLQRRWEDADGNIYAKRVGTGRERFSASTSGWINGHNLVVNYGDISDKSFYQPYMGLIPAEKSYYARNTKGKMVPVKEVGWDSADATPTHIIVMFSAGCGEPYTGTPGLTLWVDNVGLVL